MMSFFGLVVVFDFCLAYEVQLLMYRFGTDRNMELSWKFDFWFKMVLFFLQNDFEPSYFDLVHLGFCQQ